jgi:hypothetical protein
MAKIYDKSKPAFKPFTADELVDGKKDFAGLSLREVLLKVVNAGTTPDPTPATTQTFASTFNPIFA